MAGRGKAKMKSYEAKDRVMDRRAGIKEGSPMDVRRDNAAPPPKPRKPKGKGGK